MARTKTRAQASDIKIGNVKSVEGMAFKVPARTSAYKAVAEQMSGLKPGQCFTVAVPDGVDPSLFSNRLNPTVQKANEAAPKGIRYNKRTTADGKNIAVICSKQD